MDDILETTFSNEFSWMKIIVSSLKFHTFARVDPALFHGIAWRRKGNKPLPEPIMTQFCDAYILHQTSVS